MTWYTDACGIMAMGLLYMLTLWLKCIYVYMGLESNSCFVTGATMFDC
jgi:hypothetical protein